MGAPPTLSAPDGKLRAIGHMSKAMTGGRAGGGQGSLFCAWKGRVLEEGEVQGVPEAAARSRDTQAG